MYNGTHILRVLSAPWYTPLPPALEPTTMCSLPPCPPTRCPLPPFPLSPAGFGYGTHGEIKGTVGVLEVRPHETINVADGQASAVQTGR